jgi:hypothetical protein
MSKTGFKMTMSLPILRLSGRKNKPALPSVISCTHDFATFSVTRTNLI